MYDEKTGDRSIPLLTEITYVTLIEAFVGMKAIGLSSATGKTKFFENLLIIFLKNLEISSMP